jgi:hypothetical protein
MVSSPDPAADERGCILLFDAQLLPCGETAPAFPMRDLHQVMVRGDTLWATCSFDNMIAVRQGGTWDAWYPLGEPAGEPRDVNHFNTLAWLDDGLAIVAHNKSAPPSEILLFDWPSRALRDRIPLGVQAHDVWREGGDWAVCSSGEGRIVTTSGRVIETGGFPRGVDFSRDEICLGISELAERQERDFSLGRLRFHDRGWNPKRTLLLEGEGLVLDVRAAPASWSAPISAARRSFRFEPASAD